MKSTISIRQLTASELVVYKKAGIDNKFFTPEPISIMGSSENFYIRTLNIPIEPNLVDLGPGYGYQDLSSPIGADGIANLPIEWQGIAFSYFLNILKEFDIPILSNEKFDLVFFETKNSKLFIECLFAGENALNRWLDNRSLLSSWFGANYPDYEKEGEPIRDEIRKAIISSL